jgi:peptide methionine sulfoxide reductase msrA/msrB
VTPKNEEKMLMEATFAGGCFWCMQPIFENLPGVQQVVVGYMGGQKAHPHYEDVARGTTGHREVVHLLFDPTQTSYSNLLDIFFHHIDPTDHEGQFVDKGSQYLTEIFYHNIKQQRIALLAKEQLQKAGVFSRDIVTRISKAQIFYPAENVHQGYSIKNSARYQVYEKNSGRQCFLAQSWNGKCWRFTLDD